MSSINPIQYELVRKWLDSHLDIPLDDVPVLAKQSHDMERFHAYYYGESDEDLIHSSNALSIKKMNQDNPAEEEYNKMLDYATEIYRDDFNRKYRRVLIQPDTPRYHTNNIFKKLVDSSDIKRFKIRYNGTHHNIIDVRSKEKFYEFCYNNSH